MRYAIIVLFLPALLWAQGFEFQFEPDSIPVTINGWQPFCPWVGGISESNPAITDIDGDRDLDIFLGEYFGWIRFFRNEGDSTLPEITFVTDYFDSIFVAESRNNPCFRDLDADGDLDLVTGDIDGNVYYYLNIGTVSAPDLVLETNALVPAAPPWCSGPELIDIDADGDYDLFGGNYGQVTFYRNIGTVLNYNFVLITGNFLPQGVGDRALPEFVDIDADNDLDLFVGTENGNIAFYRNDGDSVNYSYTYVTDHYFNIDVGDYASPEFADIDGDGDYDLFVGREPDGYTNMRGDVYFYENAGYAANPQFQLITNNYLTADLGYWSISPQVVDLNGDHAPDLLTGTGSTLTYFQNIGDSSHPSFNFMTETFQGIYRQVIKPCLADLDADGDFDLLAGEGVILGPPTVAFYLNRGTPLNPQFILYNSSYITNPDFFVNTNPGLADIDADGDLDLFITDDHGHFYYYQNNGNAQAANFVLVSSQWQGIQFYYPYDGWRGFSFGDLDHDGDYDLLMENLYTEVSQANLRFYRNVGSSQVANMVMETNTFLPDNQIYRAYPFLTDIDSDSDLDLFVGEGNGGIMFFRNVTGQSPVDPRKRLVPTYPTIELTLQPNPGNPVAIVLSLPAPQPATLAVYNLLGAKVATLTSGLQPAGVQRYFWETAPFASGVYLVRLEARKGAYAPGGETLAKKLVVVK